MPIHPKISPSFVFPRDAEKAVAFYTSVFPESRIIKTMYANDGSGMVRMVSFELMGQYFAAANGDDSFTFGQGLSLMIECDTQAEIDALYGKLQEGGGKAEPCGWVTDRFGVSWQIVPKMVARIMDGPDGAAAERVLDAMYAMTKLDIAQLEQAARG